MGKVWLGIGFFAYKCVPLSPVCLLSSSRTYDSYDMQYFHDMSHCPNPLAIVKVYVPPEIAASTARPISPPTAFRTTPRQRPGKLERTHMVEGRCHRCARWVPVQGVKDPNAKV
ncbi:hypothetical protein BJV78DRAFT_1283974 [Lactifluus subvellereus]|nr:hypothetical protein BJV78DRAFT_1283974 [Lactifluus subvellereus]